MNYCFSVPITKQDHWYVARCPELGVTSQGEDVESAQSKLREAIELYIETWGVSDLPKLSSQTFWTVIEVAH